MYGKTLWKTSPGDCVYPAACDFGCSYVRLSEKNQINLRESGFQLTNG